MPRVMFFIRAVLILLPAAFSLCSADETGAVTGPSELARLAVGDGERETRFEAVRKLSDQEALAGVAMEAGDRAVGFTALGKLTAADAIASVARGAQDAGIRFAAVGKIFDREALREIEGDGSFVEFRPGPEDIAVVDKNFLARRAAAVKLGREEAIPQPGENVLWAVTDQSRLKEKALDNRRSLPYRLDAVWYLADQEALAGVVMKAEEDAVRESAMEKITDDKLIAAVNSGGG